MLDKLKDIEKIQENFVAEKTLTAVHGLVSAVLFLLYASEKNKTMKALQKVPIEKYSSIVSLGVFVLICGIIYKTLDKEVKESVENVYTYDKKLGNDVITLSGLHLVLSLLLVLFAFRKAKVLKMVDKLISKSKETFVLNNVGYFWLVSLAVCVFLYMRYSDVTIKEKYTQTDKEIDHSKM